MEWRRIRMIVDGSIKKTGEGCYFCEILKCHDVSFFICAMSCKEGRVTRRDAEKTKQTLFSSTAFFTLRLLSSRTLFHRRLFATNCRRVGTLHNTKANNFSFPFLLCPPLCLEKCNSSQAFAPRTHSGMVSYWRKSEKDLGNLSSPPQPQIL